MMNYINLIGRLTKDVELHATGNGLSVCSFSVACDRDFGEKQTDFIDCVAWRQTAEFISKYFRKGSWIGIGGRLQVRDYEDKQGNKRKVYEILVDNAYFCGDKEKTATVEWKQEEATADTPFFL